LGVWFFIYYENSCVGLLIGVARARFRNRGGHRDGIQPIKGLWENFFQQRSTAKILEITLINVSDNDIMNGGPIPLKVKKWRRPFYMKYFI